jgi:hypothetical protein
MPKPKITVDALTNSFVMACSKEAAKLGIDLYRVDPNEFLRNMLRGYSASILADQMRPTKRTKN